MIPILFEYNEMNFSSHGIGDLIDCIACEAQCNDDGEYELSFIYPKDGELFSELTIGRLIYAKANSWQQNQIFRIYGYEKKIGGQIAINCEHISYDLNRIPVKKFKSAASANCNTALANVKSNAVAITGLNISKFTFTSNVTGTAQTQDGYYEVDGPTSARSAILDGDDSVKGVFGGNLVLDNYALKLLAPGSDESGMNRGVLIEYGVDLIDLDQEENISEMYTGVLPYFRYRANDGDEDDTIAYGTVQYISGTFRNHRITPLDLTEYFPNQAEHTAPSAAQLNSKAQEWMQNEDGFGEPEVNLTLSYAALGQDVRLHDQVTVRFLKLGIDVAAKVTSYKYDVLAERMKEIEVGKTKKTILFSLEDASRLKKGLLPPKRIQDKSITSEKYADGSVGSYAIGNGAVGSNKIAGGAVTSGKIAGGAVTEEKVAKDAITELKIKDNAVVRTKISDSAVNYQKLADSAVTVNKIANGAVISDKIAVDAVTADKILSGAVTNAKILDKAVSFAKLNSASVDDSKFTEDMSVTWSDVLATRALFAGYIYSEGVIQCQSILVGSTQYNTKRKIPNTDWWALCAPSDS